MGAETSLRQDTIVAIATAIVPAQGSVGIVRLSGDQALAIAQQMTHSQQPWESHRLRYGKLYDGETLLDEALCVWMQAPRSFTREDVVEFHCHGGIVVVQQIMQTCVRLGARLAQAGEFSLRAFLNGRIDLTQAEGMADLVTAQSQAAAQMALAGLTGQLAQQVRTLREQALDLLAELEARIDFAEDLPPLDHDLAAVSLQQLRGQVDTLLATAARGELLRQGIKVAIVGQPNVGKSSLLNAWSGQDRAIVTDLPGTTRDVVESTLVVGGIPIRVLDTAGIRDTTDRVEQLGIERALNVAQDADLVIMVIAAPLGWGNAEQAILDRLGAKPRLIVLNKRDLGEPACPHTVIPAQFQGDVAAQQASIERLEAAVLAQFQQQLAPGAQTIAINQRQTVGLERAKQALALVAQAMQADLAYDFWTIDLREAIEALGELTGDSINESVLDRIFSRFCLGK